MMVTKPAKAMLNIVEYPQTGGTIFLRECMSKYIKPSLSVAEQIELMRSRGMIINDLDATTHHLQHNNYYRLRAYWYPFETDHTTHHLQAGTTFDDVFNLYSFDTDLQKIVMNGLQMIEISVKRQWTYHSAQKSGAFGYADPLHNREMVLLETNKQSLLDEVARSDEVFIEHFFNKYGDEHALPPVWMASELMSFGLLSRWYKNLHTASVRRDIANTYGVDNGMLNGLLHHFVYVRNLCAHHSRLWNRQLVVQMPKVKNKPRGLSQNLTRTKTRKVYNTLVMIAHFTEIIQSKKDLNNHWKRDLVDLIVQSSDIDTQAMGFPEEWQTFPIWQFD